MTLPTQPPDDAELVRRARGGDAEAFDALARRHYRLAYAIALGVTGTTMDAEDVCHDALLRALDRLDECRQPERFGAWLGQIVRNAALNHLRSRKRRDGPSAEELHLSTPEVAVARTERQELRGRLLEALDTLDPIKREVLLLHDLEGWRHKAIAEQVGCSEGMSRLHLFNARKKLRALLGADLLAEYTHE